MRERNNNRRAGRGSAAGPAGAVAAIGQRLWTKASHRPVDSMAIACAVTASFIVIVNAVFLQSGAHPAPFFANPTALTQAAENRPAVPAAPAPKPLEALPAPVPARSTMSARAPVTAQVRRNDPIGDLIGSATGSSAGARPRVAAVQRVLAEFGYGQIKPSGVLDEPTSAAIAKFEGEHKMPVTGRPSDRLLSELATMTGRPIE